MSDNTPIGDRMKRYEHAFRQYMPRRSYTLMRLDGRAFHSYLRNAEKPFDRDFMNEMNLLAQRLCEEIQGARFAYVQSDEISILATDFDEIGSEPWFGGNLNKLLSVTASLAGAYMTKLRYFHPGLPQFDCRVWSMTDPVEVANYFLWRQQDAVRNSIQMVGQHYFGHTRLNGVSGNQIQEMLWSEHQVNWDKLPPECKRGRLVAPIGDSGFATVAAPHFKAEPDTTLAQLIPPMPRLHN